jgi:L-threonylcarbamoyladenylate synthase
MKTKVFSPTPQNIEFCGQQIRQGKIVCYKSDTTYGIGANPFDDKAVEKIFVAKKRPDNKPIILLASKNFDFESLVHITPQAKTLMQKHWPGPLTIIFPLKNNTLSAHVTCGQNTVAIRMPNDTLCNTLCEHAGGLITSTSANISGQPVKNSAREILAEFEDGAFDFLLDSGEVQNTLPSTIVDATTQNIVVLRQGSVVID